MKIIFIKGSLNIKGFSFSVADFRIKTTYSGNVGIQ